MSKSSIAWTGHTWNPVKGCGVVSPGCTHCYAMRTAHRLTRMDLAANRPSHYAGLTEVTKAGPVWTDAARFVPGTLGIPMRRRKPTLYFVNSMSDMFHRDITDDQLDLIFAVMSLRPQHVFQILTKREERMVNYLNDPTVAERVQGRAFGLSETVHEVVWPLPNVWMGVSVEDGPRADLRIPLLLKAKAAVRWVSAEPLIGPVDLTRVRAGVSSAGETLIDATLGIITAGAVDGIGGISESVPTLDWVVAGAESGDGRRAMPPEWARALRDQCAVGGVPFFMKQMDVGGGLVSEAIELFPVDLQIRQWPRSGGPDGVLHEF